MSSGVNHRVCARGKYILCALVRCKDPVVKLPSDGYAVTSAGTFHTRAIAVVVLLDGTAKKEEKLSEGLCSRLSRSFSVQKYQKLKNSPADIPL